MLYINNCMLCFHQIVTPVSNNFIEYIKSQPILFEVFGHYHHHPLHKDAKQEVNTGTPKHGPPRRLQLPPCIPISAPVRSSRFTPLPQLTSPTTSHVAKKIDLLVWFEICELANSGEYVPCTVTHGDNLPCRGVFILHQGLQRRIRITIAHESDEDVKWRDVREVLIGKLWR